MRLVMVCRKYSGIGRDAWSPAGTPAVLKLIEELEARGIATTVLFLAKSPQAGASDLGTDYGRFKHVKFVHVAWRGARRLPAVLSEAVNSLRQLVRIVPYVLGRADLLYFDRGHLGFAALASLFHRRVVWRCLGVMSFLLARDAGKRMGAVYLRLARILVQFPIRLMICTNDGSPWYRLFRGRGARRRLLLLTNGIDVADAAAGDRPRFAGAQTSQAAVPTIGYVGRATVAKGVDIFVEACIALARRGAAFRAVVVGDGADRAAAEARAVAAGLAGVVRFVGAVPQAEVARHLSAMHIYVSPAHNGGFANTMLEALASGCCVVALGPDPARGVDVTTVRFLPANVVRWVDRVDPAAAIAAAVAELLADPAQCERHQNAALDFARTRLMTWRERVKLEIDLMEGLAKGVRPPAGTMPCDSLAQIAYAAAEP